MKNNNTMNPLSEDEIITILVAAKGIIMYGGKGLLGKILGGSKDKRIFTADLHHSESYGAFEGMTQKVIMEKVEWMIENGYLTTDEKLSLLVYTQKGWDVVIEELADELYGDFRLAAEFGRFDFIEVVRSQPLDLRMLLLDVVEEEDDPELIEMLIQWLEIEADAPIPERIHEVIQNLDKSHTHSSANKRNSNDLGSVEANKKWLSIPADFRQMLIRNVFCGNCLDTVQIEKYIIKDFRDTIVLEGKCKKCGNNVARIID
ncbi:RQC-minor-1 family DNA-binding protein [Bacillus sp. JJ1609]|uniref:RQC-minor-1 family DNA-binding protein n=1 Tax=Bacillus sp. JJ1609 TaxID=3122977 RepID=UPI002FFF70D3